VKKLGERIQETLKVFCLFEFYLTDLKLAV